MFELGDKYYFLMSVKQSDLSLCLTSAVMHIIQLKGCRLI